MFPWQPVVVTKFAKVLIAVEIKPTKSGFNCNLNHIVMNSFLCCYGNNVTLAAKFADESFWPVGSLEQIWLRSVVNLPNYDPKECLHWSTSKPVKLVSFTDQILPIIWSVDFGYLLGSFTWMHNKEIYAIQRWSYPSKWSWMGSMKPRWGINPIFHGWLLDKYFILSKDNFS